MDQHGQFSALLDEVGIVMIFKNNTRSFRKNKNVRDQGKKEKPRMTREKDEQ
jgi:hypothetical protein